MNILVISHNVFCSTSSMGKTLRSYFVGLDAENIAQLYIHSEVPTDPICKNYYRMTDTDIIKSVITRRSGRVYGEEDLKAREVDACTVQGMTGKLYQKGRARTPLIYAARNLWWSLGAWKTGKLQKWLDDFAPDVVFFAAGDYAFMYKIALWVAESRKIPLVVSCMDDYYFHNKNEAKFGGKMVHKRFMKLVNRVMNYADCLFPICERMSRQYSELFHKPCYTIHTPSSFHGPLEKEKTNAISYIGNLGYQRHKQLVKLGQALKKVDCPDKPDFIDVYSTEARPEILAGMTKENGICFHGGISSEQVLEVMAKSIAVIHTESFDEITRKSVAYSVSTKIADSLASGTCIFAYGPAEIASIEYLSKHNAAICAAELDDPVSALTQMLTDEGLRTETIRNALALAECNHRSEKNCEMIRTVLKRVCGK